MVKGISRQVIMVPSPDPELFDQAIFILKDSAVRQGVTDEMLVKQAKAAIGHSAGKKHSRFLWGLLCGLGGGAAAVILSAALWLM